MEGAHTACPGLSPVLLCHPVRGTHLRAINVLTQESRMMMLPSQALVQMRLGRQIQSGLEGETGYGMSVHTGGAVGRPGGRLGLQLQRRDLMGEPVRPHVSKEVRPLYPGSPRGTEAEEIHRKRCSSRNRLTQSREQVTQIGNAEGRLTGRTGRHSGAG